MLEGAGIIGLIYLIVILIIGVVRIALWLAWLPFKLLGMLIRASFRSSARRRAVQRQKVNQWVPIPLAPETAIYDLSGTATVEKIPPRPPRHESNLWPPPTYGEQSF